MRPGDADKGLRPGRAETGEHAADAHAGIDHHRHGADLEDGENDLEEFEAGAHHENGADAPADSGVLQTVGQPVRFALELLKGEMGIDHAAVAAAARWADHRALEGLLLRRAPQVRSHVHVGGAVVGRIRHAAALLDESRALPVRRVP